VFIDRITAGRGYIAEKSYGVIMFQHKPFCAVQFTYRIFLSIEHDTYIISIENIEDQNINEIFIRDDNSL
jgi:hypothetical protein